MKKLIIALVILMASFTTVNAENDTWIENNKRIAVCYFEGKRFVFQNVKWFGVAETGETVIALNNGAIIEFVGGYSCMSVRNNDELVDEIKLRFDE